MGSRRHRHSPSVCSRPLEGGPVAVTPPKIAVDMGLCEPDDVWFVDQALYGLRES